MNALAPQQGIIQVVDGEIMLGNELKLSLERIRQQAAQIIVSSKDSSAEAKELAKQSANEVKVIYAAMEPERLARKKALEDWTRERDRLAVSFIEATAKISTDARAFDIAEIDRAQAEQRRLNYRKPAERHVEVKPDVQTVADTRLVPKYRATVLDEAKVKRDYLSPNIQKIEKKAREDKDPEKTMKEVGGVRIVRI